MTKRQRGVCPVCGGEFAVTFTGETWRLSRHGLPPCAGSRQEPTAVIGRGR